MGQYLEAIGHLNKALIIRKNHMGEEDLSVANTLENIAMIEVEQG